MNEQLLHILNYGYIAKCSDTEAIECYHNFKRKHKYYLKFVPYSIGQDEKEIHLGVNSLEDFVTYVYGDLEYDKG